MKDPATATERVGRYQLLEPIGAGPNGTVSRAKVFGVAGFERQFAIKRFLPELTSNPAQAQALSAAARSYSSLEHPRIARMSEFGVAQGQTFTAVEYVTGLDAMRLLSEAKLGGTGLAAGGALALISQAARAVGYAHGRGLSHLGLAPTNVLVTAEGDIKVTDFGVLAALMPARPVEVPRLANRIGYLAPEQLAGEATSAATDVFVLGVIAYELVSGQRAYGGTTPAAIAQAILAGPPADPALPRPIVRVLQRCVARSPFERFPDARAFADALDAALRVAPVPGTRKDIGAQVKATLDRFAAMNEGNLSGMVALNVGTGPIQAAVARESQEAIPTNQFVRPDVPVAGPPPLVGPTRSGSPSDAPKPLASALGVTPRPIPALPAPVPIAQATSPTPASASTRKPISVPPVIPSVLGANGPDASRARSPSTERAALKPATPPRAESVTAPDAPRVDAIADLVTELEDERDKAPSERKPPRTTDPQGFLRELPTGEMSPLLADKLNRASTRSTGELPAALAEAYSDELGSPDQLQAPPEIPTPTIPRAHSTMPGVVPASAATRKTPPPKKTVAIRTSSGRSVKLLLGAVVLGGLGAGGWFVWTSQQAASKNSRTVVASKGSGRGSTDLAPGSADKGSADRGSADRGSAGSADRGSAGSADRGSAGSADRGSAGSTDQGSAGSTDQGSAAAVPVDAGAAKVVADAAVTAPAGSSDALQITTTPAGARVFIDGADQGAAPVKMPGSADRHTMALLLPGHDLYLAEIDGHGTLTIPLKAVTPPGGPAGIKVIKCKDKERYYVYVDGKPTGMTCPTERIDCDVGPHTVEVYDVVTETRRKWDIQVKDTRLSVRVRVD